METNGHMFYKDQKFLSWVVWTNGWYKNKILKQFSAYTKAKKDLNLDIKTMTIPPRNAKFVSDKNYERPDSLGGLMYRMAMARYFYDKSIEKWYKKAGCKMMK
jgi:hypothetical protein